LAKIAISLTTKVKGCKGLFLPVRRSLAYAQPFLNCSHAYANRENSPNANVEIATVGVQNRVTRNILLLSRLAVKNKAKKETARIQNRGEKILS
jgi:hypothetical protein